MSAKTDTWMPFYVADYFADTRHLTTLEHGAYMLLLLTYWRNQGPLPDDDSKLSRITGLTLKQWKAIRPTIIEFFQIGDGQIESKRSEEEIDKSKTRSLIARGKALKRYGNGAAGADGGHSPEGKEPAKNGQSSSSPSSDSSDAKASSPGEVGRADIDSAYTLFVKFAAEHGLPEPFKLTDQRRAKLKLRLKEGGGLDGWRRALENLAHSPHCLGENDRGWRADIDYLLQPKGFMKTLEGAFRKDGKNGAPASLFDPAPTESKEIQDWRTRLLNSKKNGGFWPAENWGPPPGDPRCECPAWLVTEFANGVAA